MRTAPFKYTRASTVAEVLDATGRGGVILAGGQSLVQAMKLRRLAPGHLVDINAVSDLAGIEVTSAGSMKIGALTRHAEIAASPFIQERVPWLSDAAKKIADVQVRNRGSIGGNLCWADSRANLPPVLISLGARAIIQGPEGVRILPVEQLFSTFQRNTLAAGELLTAIEIPPLAEDTRGCYLELARQPNSVPTVNVAVTISGGPITYIGVGIGGLAPTPIRAISIERELHGRIPTQDDVIRTVTAFSIDQLQPVTDVHGPIEYRIHIGRVLLKRALLSSLGLSNQEKV